jgi:large subunit ribosomal protein L5
MTPRLLERYRSDVHEKLMAEFGYRNPLQVPTLSKIVVNVGLGEAAANPKLLDRAAEELAVISGQKPIIRRARKSVANFKLRAGQAIGCAVTLRGYRM